MLTDRFILSKNLKTDYDKKSLFQLLYISSICIIWLWLNFYPIFTAILIYVRIRTNLICVDKNINCKKINKNFIIATYLSIIYKLGYSLYNATIWCQIFLFLLNEYPKIMTYIFPSSKHKNSYFTVIYLIIYLWMCWG